MAAMTSGETQQLEKENSELIAKLDDQAKELYDAMEELTVLKAKEKGNRGKAFHEVQAKQKKRQLEKLR